MKWAGKTDVGIVRKINEDSFVCHGLQIDKISQSTQALLCIIADGMGGCNAGEVASAMAVTEIMQYINGKLDNLNNDEKSIKVLIEEAVLYANDKIYQKSLQDNNYSGMGTTLSLALITNDCVYIGHVGDSRIYAIRNDKIARVTEDHSLVTELVRNGSIKPEEADHHPQKHIITRALGTEDSIEVDIDCFKWIEGDVVMLCSDGLSNRLEDNMIKRIIEQACDLDNACLNLIEQAKQNGSTDNITVVVVQNIAGGGCCDR